MTIPLSKDFAISSGVVSPAGNGVDAIGLMLTTSSEIGTASVQSFSMLSDVANTFGYTSDEYVAASVYFAGFTGAAQLPSELLVVGISSQATAGKLISGSNASVKIEDIAKLPASTITLNIDGVETTSKAIDFSAVTTQADVAKAIQTALKGVNVSWGNNTYTISSSSVGKSTTVIDAQGDIASALKLTEELGARSVDGTDTMTLTEIMDKVVDVDTNWFGFACAQDLTAEQKQELAAWTATQDGGNRYVYSVTGEDASMYESGGVFVNHGDASNAFAVLAFAASMDFSKTSGRLTYKFRQFTGMKNKVTSLSEAMALESAGVNYYGEYSQNAILKNYAASGAITGQFKWIDTFLDQMWIKANLISAYTNLFLNNQSYSFNSNGYAAVKAATVDVMQSAINYGAIQKGVTLDSAQTQIINQQVGKDITGALFTDGWYLHIPTQSGANRLDRTLKGVVLFWVDGQMIQSINMQSTTVL
ncbi:DUF3383 family protein [Providencia rettgeri]